MTRARAGRLTLLVLALIALGLLGAIVYPFASALLFAAVLAGAFQPMLERLSEKLGKRREALGQFGFDENALEFCAALG